MFKKKKKELEKMVHEEPEVVEEENLEDILIQNPEEEKLKNMTKAERKAYKKEKKRERRKEILDAFNWAMLRKEIEAYGYHYSFKEIMFQMLKYFALVVLVSWVLRLHFQYILALIVIVFIAFPIIVRAQYSQMYQIKRFLMVTSYLDNVLPIFKAKPMITHAWTEVLDLVDGEMHDAVQEALDYLANDTEDVNALETACEIIESHFPNSRIHAVHKMMMTVMRQNSKTYQASVDNVFYDVSEWIMRTMNFQKELEDKKSKLLMICLITIAADCLFIAVYSTNEIFVDFPEMGGYQVSTFLFVAVLLIMMCAIFVKMTGSWLVDDQTTKLERKYEKSFNYMISNEKKTGVTKNQIAMSIAFLVIGIVSYASFQNAVFFVVFLVMAAFMYTSNSRTYKANRKRVQRAIEMEFPIWLRDVALNLNNMTVLNAIENSKQMASPILDYYIDKFLKQAYENPRSIKPYNEFLSEYSLPDVKSSMKVLYTLQEIDANMLEQQTNSLIVRNQEQLSKAEKMRNDDSVSSVTKFGFVPVAAFMIQMLISMVLMFIFMMNFMGQTMAGLGM